MGDAAASACLRALLLVLLSGIVANAGEVRVCLPSESVSSCSSVMSRHEGNGVSFRCVAPNGGSCSRMIQQREADFTVVGDVELYWANKRHGLIAYVSEDYRNDRSPASTEELVDYYSVAVVKSDHPLCNEVAGKGFSALKGSKACHTGYRKNAGWDLPVGFLAQSGLMTIREDPENRVNTDAFSVARFFSQVCAPRTTPDGPVNDASGNGQNYRRLCELCENKQTCSESDKYYDYGGALQCMMDGVGDVAFVKHTTALEDTPNIDKDDYSLLCFGSSNGCRPLGFYQQSGCSLGERPPNALVAREGWGDSVDGLTVIDRFTRNDDFLNDAKGLLWNSKTRALTRINNPTNFKAFMRSFDNYDQIYQMGDAGNPFSPSSSSSSTLSSSSRRSSGVKNGVVDGGGAAGIAIGCFFGGVFVLAAIMWVVNRKRKSNWDQYNGSQQHQPGSLQGFKESTNPVATAPPMTNPPPVDGEAKGAMRV